MAFTHDAASPGELGESERSEDICSFEQFRVVADLLDSVSYYALQEIRRTNLSELHDEIHEMPRARHVTKVLCLVQQVRNGDVASETSV